MNLQIIKIFNNNNINLEDVIQAFNINYVKIFKRL